MPRRLTAPIALVMLLLAAAPVARASTLLYDNGPLVTHPGGGAGGADASAVQTALGMNVMGSGLQEALGNRLADEFTIPGPIGWFVDELTFFAYQTGSPTSPSSFTSMNYRIWNGPPNDPTSTVVFGDTATNRLLSSAWSNIYRVTDTTLASTLRPVMSNTVSAGVALPPGTYWLDWQAAGSLGSGPWASPISILGQTTTGNAMQFSAATWNPVTDMGFPQGYPFLVRGDSLLLFSDDFSDGDAAGDPQWTKVRGTWRVGTPAWHGNPLYLSTPRRRALSLVTGFTATGARIETQIKLGRTLRRRNVSFVFDYQDPLHYRFVQLRQLPSGKWRILLRQKGDFDGDVAGTKASALLPGFNRKLVHQLRIDTLTSGPTQVSIDGTGVLAGSFAGASSGGAVGLASDMTGLFADTFTVLHESYVGPF